MWEGKPSDGARDDSGRREAALVCFDNRRNKEDLRAIEEPVEKMLFVSLLCDSMESESFRLLVARLSIPATVDVKDLFTGAEAVRGDWRLSCDEGRRWCDNTMDPKDEDGKR